MPRPSHTSRRKGDEIAWYTNNYNTKKDASDAYIGSVQKTWSLTSYDGKIANDSAVTTETAMTDSYRYKLDAFGLDASGNVDATTIATL